MSGFDDPNNHSMHVHLRNRSQGEPTIYEQYTP